MKIELLYIDACPSYQMVKMDLEQILAEAEAEASIEMVRVVDVTDAVSKHFLGSPTLRVNGADLFPDQMSGVYAMQCRVYRTPAGLRGVPSKGMLRAALQNDLPQPQSEQIRLRPTDL